KNSVISGCFFEANPAIRCNLFILSKKSLDCARDDKTKRIFAAIRARAFRLQSNLFPNFISI
ncbi:MAG TPA: hypothetical protein VK476_02215, partial [Flavobacterium sp.]|nr:hypothetical protein [Flavobacterium sp.]